MHSFLEKTNLSSSNGYMMKNKLPFHSRLCIPSPEATTVKFLVSLQRFAILIYQKNVHCLGLLTLVYTNIPVLFMVA